MPQLFLNQNWVVTIKRDLVPSGPSGTGDTVYMFTDPLAGLLPVTVPDEDDEDDTADDIFDEGQE